MVVKTEFRPLNTGANTRKSEDKWVTLEYTSHLCQKKERIDEDRHTGMVN